MTITQLETFLKITETGNFTAAANQLGYAQSTVTTQIKLLEEELSCRLFERLGKTIVLTPEGERLAAYAEKMTQLKREILLEVPMKQEPSGVIRLGVSDSFCYDRLPQILLEYKQRYPSIDIQLTLIMHDTFPAMLKKGMLDIAWSLNPEINYPDLTILSEKPESLGFYVSPKYPLAKKRQICETDLIHVPLLLTSHTCTFRQMLIDDLASVSIVPQIALETNSKEILKQFAVNGLGVAFMPDIAVQKEAESGLLMKLDWAGKAFPVFSRVYIHKDKHLSAVVRELVSIIKQIEKAEGDDPE